MHECSAPLSLRSVSALSAGATAAFVVAAFFALQALKGYLKVVGLEKKERSLSGSAE